METREGIIGGHKTSLKDNVAQLLKSVNRLKDEYIWPSVSLLAFLRPLHYWAMGNKLKLENGQRVLEIGSGYPLYKIYSGKVGSEGIFVSLDINPNIQERSRKICYWVNNLLHEKKPTESHLVSDAGKLPFAGETFDVVVANNFTGEKESYIQEAFRVLKPGGRLVTTAMEVLAIPIASRQNTRICNKAGFIDVKPRIGTPADIMPPGFMWNWYVEARKPE